MEDTVAKAVACHRLLDTSALRLTLFCLHRFQGDYA